MDSFSKGKFSTSYENVENPFSAVLLFCFDCYRLSIYAAWFLDTKAGKSHSYGENYIDNPLAGYNLLLVYARGFYAARELLRLLVAEDLSLPVENQPLFQASIHNSQPAFHRHFS
ncbi:MAG: hypothetical protein E7323_02605 [Clostridiales bacterium]|nr:hypothetical protein [Clostridiales bacterium]